MLNDGKNKGKVVLQKRSEHNKTFHNLCQATWAGKAEPNETVESAIKRECAEELGEKFCGKFDFSKLEFLGKEYFTIENKKWESYNYLGNVSEEILKMADLHSESLPELVFVGTKDNFYSVKSKKDPQNNIVLFDDQYKILSTILNGVKGNNK